MQLSRTVRYDTVRLIYWNKLHAIKENVTIHTQTSLEAPLIFWYFRI